jgi:hypothetical protein
LTGWKIDIKSESDARKLGIYPVEEPLFSKDLDLSDIGPHDPTQGDSSEILEE